MKTQIIQLEVHDDTISVRDKMDWSQTPRILLVWPERGKVLRARLDLVLLQRYSTSHGSQLALLTRDPEVIFQASEVGIPVFQSRKTAQLQPWGKSFREYRRRELGEKAAEIRDSNLLSRPEKNVQGKMPAWTRISIFIGAVSAVLTIGGMLLPKATISIPREFNEKRLTIPVYAILGVDQVRISGQIPVRELPIQVEARHSVPASGSTAIPSTYARGEVLFTNLGDEPITIPGNTILSTDSEDPIQFRTDSPGELLPEVGDTIAIAVTAVNPGMIGNIGPGQITTVSSLLEAELTVSNPDPTSGGEDILISAPNESDRRRLERNLLLDLKSQAREQLSGLLAGDDLLLSADLNDFDLIVEDYFPPDGSPGDELEGETRVQFNIHYASAEDLFRLAVDTVNAQYQKKDFSPLPDTISISHLSQPAPAGDQSYSWSMEISWQEEKVIDQNAAIQAVLGKKPADAAVLLEDTLGLENPPQISLVPSWWLRIPALPFRIHLREGGPVND